MRWGICLQEQWRVFVELHTIRRFYSHCVVIAFGSFGDLAISERPKTTHTNVVLRFHIVAAELLL